MLFVQLLYEGKKMTIKAAHKPPKEFDKYRRQCWKWKHLPQEKKKINATNWHCSGKKKKAPKTNKQKTKKAIGTLKKLGGEGGKLNKTQNDSPWKITRLSQYEGKYSTNTEESFTWRKKVTMDKKSRLEKNIQRHMRGIEEGKLNK